MFKHSNKVILGVDVGGSHISSALVNAGDGSIIEESFVRKTLNANVDCISILKDWTETLKASLSALKGHQLAGVGVAMPGPFDYEKGISLIKGRNKYQALYAVNVREVIRTWADVADLPIVFENDASCFALGEAIYGEASCFDRVIAITLGTGLGGAFIENRKLLKKEQSIPEGGCLYNVSFREGIAEDYISTGWLLNSYSKLSGKQAKDVKAIAEDALGAGDQVARNLFRTFGENIGECLLPWTQSFKADCLLIGGSIARSSDLFLSELIANLQQDSGHQVAVKISTQMERSTIAGAAALVSGKLEEEKQSKKHISSWRKSSQELMPCRIEDVEKTKGGYNRYPFHSLKKGSIFSGYESLAEWMAQNKAVVIDGYVGNDWALVRNHHSDCFREKNIRVVWYEMDVFLKTEQEIEELVKPFLGTPDSVWGKKTSLRLKDFYRTADLEELQLQTGENTLSVLIGPGSALASWEAPVVYIDLPKNELQFRMRAKTALNLGSSVAGEPPAMYKRFYFVDWVVLNEHRKEIKNRIEVIADGQWKEKINWAFHSAIATGLQGLSRTAFRVRPWFEAGAWGGQWLKKHIPSINQDEINYAWSFELIVPENGLVFESDGWLMEVAFDWLMEQNAAQVLGPHVNRFGNEFPIRFDFLDTYDGGNLSIQCHPSLNYIREQFGESITQDETYYILDCDENAHVYLGFQEDIAPKEFRRALEESFESNKPLGIKKYVQNLPAKKHDLFLIPNGTIHSAGAGNLVLEISATPYIFTFKMYDWVRPDLNGQPRPINIEHAFNNLRFERKGARVAEELVSKPEVLKQGSDWQIIHLPTHPDHFYDVHRLEFDHKIGVNTTDSCEVLMLVEGESILVETADGTKREFSYAETFVIPQAAGWYVLANLGKGRARVIKAFLK